MIEKKYKILLDDKLFGTKKLEFGDLPMGIVFGQVNFDNKSIGYDYIKQCCIDNLIEIQTDCPNDNLISTGQIENLKVYNSENYELVGIGNIIEGMDSEKYTITILGLESEVYEREFPEHIAEYKQKFNS